MKIIHETRTDGQTIRYVWAGKPTGQINSQGRWQYIFTSAYVRASRLNDADAASALADLTARFPKRRFVAKEAP